MKKIKKSLILEKLEHFLKSYFWQLPRTFAEPRRFVIVFDRQIAAPNAVFDLNGNTQMYYLLYSHITVTRRSKTTIELKKYLLHPHNLEAIPNIYHFGSELCSKDPFLSLSCRFRTKLTYLLSLNIWSALFILKAQHIPLSVGNVLKVRICNI